MPIEVTQLHEAKKPVKTRVLEFLQQDVSKAFDEFEIGAAVLGQGTSSSARFSFSLNILAEQSGGNPSPTLATLRQALEDLEEDGVIVSGQVGGARYYAAKAR